MKIEYTGLPIITVQYKGPTNTRGARYLVKQIGDNLYTKSKSFPYNYTLHHSGQHDYAARAFCQHLGWNGDLVGSSIKGMSIFIFTSFTFYGMAPHLNKGAV
jgi:hypothetical protein